MLNALNDVLASSFGPLPGEKLLLTATGKAIFTCSGPSILTALSRKADTMQGLVISAAQSHAASVGDGSKTFILMLAAALAEVEKQQGNLPEARQNAWRVQTAQATIWLAQEVVPTVLHPCLRAQARVAAGEDASALRTSAAHVASTAFGGHLGATASAALATALVSALLPPAVASSPAEPGLLDVARQRAAGVRAGGAAIVSGGGAQPSYSCALDGLLLPGGPASEEMPARLEGVGVLLLGPHAASPEVATEAEARRAGVPARLELTAQRARPTGHRRRRLAASEADDAGDGDVTTASVEWVHAERARWVRALVDSGVRLVLSGAPISPLTAHLCARAGVCAVPGVEKDDLRAISRAASVNMLREWPRAAHLPMLVGGAAAGGRVVARGGAVEAVRLGGRRYMHVRLAGAPSLATLVVRAPSASLAMEYALAAERAMACMRVWLDSEVAIAASDDTPAGRVVVAADGVAGETARAAGAGPDTPSRPLYASPGAGAAELQMDAAVRALLASTDDSRWLSGAPLSVAQRGALRVLSAALLAPPRQLHSNAKLLSALSANDGRWPLLLQRLQTAHDESSRCALGLVLEPPSRRAATAGMPRRAGVLAPADAAAAGVLEPLDVKLRTLSSMLACLAQLLRLGGAVPIRSVKALPPRPGGHRPSARTQDGSSSDETASDASAEHSDSDEGGGGGGILV